MFREIFDFSFFMYPLAIFSNDPTIYISTRVFDQAFTSNDMGLSFDAEGMVGIESFTRGVSLILAIYNSLELDMGMVSVSVERTEVIVFGGEDVSPMD